MQVANEKTGIQQYRGDYQPNDKLLFVLNLVMCEEDCKYQDHADNMSYHNNRRSKLNILFDSLILGPLHGLVNGEETQADL